MDSDRFRGTLHRLDNCYCEFDSIKHDLGTTTLIPLEGLGSRRLFGTNLLGKKLNTDLNRFGNH